MKQPKKLRSLCLAGFTRKIVELAVIGSIALRIRRYAMCQRSSP
jgi:hypothetical protein